MTGEDNNNNNNNGIITDDDDDDYDKEEEQKQQQQQPQSNIAGTNSSPTSEYLARIKEETDRIRQKRYQHHQHTVDLDRSRKERRRKKDQEEEDEGADCSTEEGVEEEVGVGVVSSKEEEIETTRTTTKKKGGGVDSSNNNDDNTNNDTTPGSTWNDIGDSSYRSVCVSVGDDTYNNERGEEDSSPVRNSTLKSAAETPLPSSYDENEYEPKEEEAQQEEEQIDQQPESVPSSHNNEDKGKVVNASVNHNFVAEYYFDGQPTEKSFSTEEANNQLEREPSLSPSAIEPPPPPLEPVPVLDPPADTTEDQEERSSKTTKKSSFFGVEFVTVIRRNKNKKSTKMSSLRDYSAATATPEQKTEHEAFCTKLIDEVLGKGAGDGKVPMDKVMMIIWQFRDDKDVIKFMTRFVSKYAGLRDVFDGIEFYLPQLAHMIIHLETELDDPILEQFSLVIAQQSIHFALQLNWILAGAIEDYQPETPDGSPNPTHNPLYYSRCIKLLTNIERVVVYRRPRSQELQQLYEKGNITKAEMDTLERADRRFTAMQITSPENVDEDENFGGNLMYKRAVRSSCFKFKRWKTRYFAIEERMLNCYNTEGGTLRRSMPIDGATVELMEQTKYPNMFRVTNLSFAFRMRASSPEDRDKWMKMLEVEATTGRVFGHTDNLLFSDENKNAQRVIDELTPSQLARYRFYRGERDFVRRLTDIAEDLRFLERPDRKNQAPGMMEKLDIPESVYSPLMGSTDIFRRIHSSVWKETKVFNTKARCPTVMNFLGVRGEMEYKGMKDVNIDLAEYMHIKFNREISGYSSTDDLTALTSLPEVSTSIQEDGKEVIMVEMDADSHSTSEKEILVVKKTASSIAEGDETKIDEATASTPKGNNGGNGGKPSVVWSGSYSEHHESAPTSMKPLTNNTKQSGTGNSSSPRRGNNQMRRFLRESMVSVPRRLVHHLDRQNSTKKNANIFDSTDMKRVPIATGSSNKEKPKELYIGRSSVMGRGKTMLGKSYRGNLDQESIERAKNIVCGGETWAEKSARMLKEYDNKPKDDDLRLEIVRFISKSNDDLRQEVFVMQMIHYYKSVFIDAGLPLWLKTYKLLSTSATTGLIEFNDDTNSLDGLKKADGYPEEGGMRKYFENTYGDPTSRSFKAAQRNFMESLAAYSIICYLLGLKDRHNGNIMIDMYGHLIHIDFGFAMGMNVGHEFTCERAPFKLTEEYVEVMGGVDDDCYKDFTRLFVEGFKAARKNSQIALGMVEIMMYKSNLPCFSGWRYGGGQALGGLQQRLCLNVPDHAVEKNVKALIDKSRDHWGTKAYDAFQLKTNGIAP